MTTGAEAPVSYQQQFWETLETGCQTDRIRGCTFVEVDELVALQVRNVVRVQMADV